MKTWFVATMALLHGTLAWAAERVPDFRLKDANPSSNRQGGQVSPRDYVRQVSGYYFGAAG